MPNWCCTTLHLQGDHDEIENLYKELSDIANDGEPLILFFEKNLAEPIRGETLSIRRDEKVESAIYFTYESAWENKMDNWREVIGKSYPSVRILFQSEEPGVGMFETNDVCGEVFKEIVKIETEYEVVYFSGGENEEAKEFFLDEYGVVIGELDTKDIDFLNSLYANRGDELYLCITPIQYCF